MRSNGAVIAASHRIHHPHERAMIEDATDDVRHSHQREQEVEPLQGGEIAAGERQECRDEETSRDREVVIAPAPGGGFQYATRAIAHASPETNSGGRT